jgi:DNA-binding CsgD family transcriptional regulator
MRVDPDMSLPGGIDAILGSRSGPAIIVAYADRRYVNDTALKLLKTQRSTGQWIHHGRRQALPPAITELCHEVRRLVRTRASVKDWEQLEVTRVIDVEGQPILLRAVPLCLKQTSNDRGVLIVLEPLRQKPSVRAARDRYGFTKREQTVVEDLLLGRTNKEIANNLGISLPSVKAHLKQIMRKTNTTTRTGVLAQILQ